MLDQLKRGRQQIRIAEAGCEHANSSVLHRSAELTKVNADFYRSASIS